VQSAHETHVRWRIRLAATATGSQPDHTGRYQRCSS